SFKSKLTFITANLLATFSLTPQAQRKSYQKETPKREFRPLRRARRLPQPPPRRLLKKAGENLSLFGQC
ncbi:MAG: hypothetical protein IKA05_06885, partial [Clostridia bacterium]|nr:hypothetical protein [Clostridia bacterium]